MKIVSYNRQFRLFKALQTVRLNFIAYFAAHFFFRLSIFIHLRRVQGYASAAFDLCATFAGAPKSMPRVFFVFTLFGAKLILTAKSIKAVEAQGPKVLDTRA